MNQKIVTIVYNDASLGVYSSLPAWQHDELFPQRHILMDQLARHEIQLSLVRVIFPSASKPARVLQATRPIFYENGLLDSEGTSFSPITLSSLKGVIIDRVGFSRLEQQGVSLPPADVSIINHSSIQELGSKFHTYTKLLAPLGIGIPTFDLQALHITNMPQELTEATAGIFVKPINGRLSLGIIYFATFALFQEKLLTLQAEAVESYIVQPEYSFTYKWPDVIAYSAKDTDMLLKSNVATIHKELRMYCFYDAQSADEAYHFPLGRVAVEGEQFMYGCDRFFINPSSCPPILKKMTLAIAQRAAKITKQRAFFIAVDFGFGVLPGEKQPRWEVIEVNTYSPYIGFVSQHAEVGAEIQKLQTEHLVRLFEP